MSAAVKIIPCPRRNAHTAHGVCLGSAPEFPWDPVEVICPDDGVCHHGCTGECWRVRNAAPLSGVFPGDVWPQS